LKQPESQCTADQVVVLRTALRATKLLVHIQRLLAGLGGAAMLQGVSTARILLSMVTRMDQ
jgi:hypothetical protein